MNLPELCIRRPVMTTLLVSALVFFGLAAYRTLPVSELPKVDFPTIQVTANLPGADPETMASSVALPLERQFSTIAGVVSMTSTSAQGTSQIALQFTLERNIDAAAQDVQAAISAALRQLPSTLPTPPTFRKVNPAELPILYLAMSSPNLPLYIVDEYAENMLAQRLSTITGVAQVQVFGSQKFAVRVQLDPDALAARRVGIDEVADAVRAANVNLPTGNPDKARTRHSPSRPPASSPTPRPTFRRSRPSGTARLCVSGSSARIVNSVENDRVASWYNGDRAVVLAIQRQPGSNTVEIVDAINKVLPTFRTQLPASVHLSQLYDRSQSIRASVEDVQFTLVLAGVLVILVIFLFLRRITATVIASLALPISTIGTFAGMYVLGYSLDNLSLLALTLSVGFVVDDAIVMLENIVRHREAGEAPLEAALKGSREIGFTILSMTASLIAVFIPVLFMGGIVGRLLNEFAVTVVLAIIVSGFVSLTLTPMMCSRLLKSEAESKDNALLQLSERGFDSICWRAISAVCDWCLGITPGWCSACSLLTIVRRPAFLFDRIPKDFLPSEDTGQIIAFTEGATGHLVRRRWSAISSRSSTIAAQGPERRRPSCRRSAPAGSAPHHEFRHARHTAQAARPSARSNADQVIQELRPKFATVPGINVYLQNPPPIRDRRPADQGAVSVHDAGPRSRRRSMRLRRAAQARCCKLPGFQDVDERHEHLRARPSHVDDRPQQGGRAGHHRRAGRDALASAFGSRQISTIYTPSNQYQVILEVAPEYQQRPGGAVRLYIRAASGKLVPLERAWRDHRTRRRPADRQPQGQLPAVTISFNLAPGVSLGTAVSASSELRARAEAAGDAQHQLPGHRAGVPSVAARAWACCC